MEELKNNYGHPCVRKYRKVKGSTVVEYVEINKLIAEQFDWYQPGKQVLFKDLNGLNLDPENLTQDWKEVKVSGRLRPVIATVSGKAVVFDSIKTCGEVLRLNPLYISQALLRGTNIGRYFIEYYFGTLPEAVIIKGRSKLPKKKEFRILVDGVGFYRMKEAAEFLKTNPSTLSIYFKQGKRTLKGHSIKKLN